MNSFRHAKVPYGGVDSPIQTDRGLELAALARITQQLRLGVSDDPKSYTAMCSAIHSNRQIWNLWAAEVSDNRNELPKELRSKIFYLSEFVNKHSRDVLKKTANASALVEVNIAVMQGLSHSGED